VNRTGVVEALDGMLAEAGADSVTAVVLVRIQRVRELLQVYGYGSGDSIGEAACKRLSGLLRPSDRLYRVGEFEFVALLPRLHDKNHGALAGHRVVRAFQSPIEVDGAEVMASMVAAVAVARGDGNTATSLLRRAEHAYTRALRRPERMALNRDGEEPRLIPYAVLRDAIAANRLAAWMQPILDLRTRQVMGAESLSRWNHPQHGPVPPDVFIPLAERTGLISELTWWSINASLRQLAEARVLRPELEVAINLSPRVFAEPGLVEHLRSTLQVWGVPPAAVTLEVTETALMEDPALSSRLLHRLCDAGFGVAFDDFGSGYSSLAYLKRFPATELKIDRAFIQDLPRDPRSVPLVRAIVDLAHQLDLVVVAEGVEDVESLELLARMGCDRAQGFFIQRPQPADEFLRALGGGEAAAARA